MATHNINTRLLTWEQASDPALSEATRLFRLAVLNGYVPVSAVRHEPTPYLTLRQQALIDEFGEITERGRQVAAQDAAARKDTKALVPKIPRPRRWSPSRVSVKNRKFPDDYQFRHRILIEMQGPHTVNDDMQISSRGLTDWYVAEYCRLNNLTRS